MTDFAVGKTSLFEIEGDWLALRIYMNQRLLPSNAVIGLDVGFLINLRLLSYLPSATNSALILEDRQALVAAAWARCDLAAPHASA